MKKVCFVALALTFIPCLTVAGEVELPRTGQTTCYDDNGNGVVCAGTAQDGEVQAGVAWPSPRFTPGTGGESDCMIDNLTGLMWPKDGNLPNGAMTWEDAIDYPKPLSLCGHSDWRLPNINELESLVNASEPSSANWLYTQGFANVQSGMLGSYWSSSTCADNTDYAWNGYLGYGTLTRDAKVNSHFVWPVRSAESGAYGNAFTWRTGQTVSYQPGDDGDLEQGTSWPSPRFIDGDNGEVTDNLTGLVWTKDANAPGPSACNPNELKNRQGALDHVKCLNAQNYLGHRDWRLPNRKELRSIFDYSQNNPALPSGHPFVNFQFFYYWSSSTYIGFATQGSEWVVGPIGNLEGLVKSANYLGVWPVRGGQVRPIITLTIAQTGQGSGSVTSDPGTVTWNGTNGFASYYYSIPVTLTAQPNAGSIFSGWSGAGCQGTGTCTANLNSDTTVTATFEREPVGKGDINYDGQLNLIDAVLALQVIAGISPQQTVYKDADVNGDAEIGFAEVIFILQKTSGLRQ